MTEPVEEIRALRRAARGAVRRPDLTNHERLRAIVELAERARASDWPWAAQTAVWEEIRDFLTELTGEEWMRRPSDYPEVPGDPVERACRALAARGLDRCPECRRPLPGEQELERWTDLRRASVDEAMQREEAVDA